MRNVTICCDMDDTIEHLIKAWVKYLNNKYCLDVDYRTIKDWEMKLAFPMLSDDQIFEPFHIPEFWDTVEIFEDAPKYIKMLIDEGFDFYICTNTHYSIAKEKFDRCLFKYFPFIKPDKIITTSNKKMIKCDILIDDALHNIVGDYIGILMDAPHNSDFKEYNEKNIFRAYNWYDVYNIIHSVINSRKGLY